MYILDNLNNDRALMTKSMRCKFQSGQERLRAATVWNSNTKFHEPKPYSVRKKTVRTLNRWLRQKKV